MDTVDRALWLWTLEASGRIGPDAFRLLSRGPTQPWRAPVQAARTAPAASWSTYQR